MAETNEQSHTEEAGKDDDFVAIRRKNEALILEMKSREEAVSRLKEDLANREKEISGLIESRDGAVRKAEELGEALTGAVTAYRELVARSNPEAVSELINGDSITEVNDSLKKAVALVEKVRQGMEAEVNRTRVPAGAPPRAHLELSDLSAREKIRYGISGNNNS